MIEDGAWIAVIKHRSMGLGLLAIEDGSAKNGREARNVAEAYMELRGFHGEILAIVREEDIPQVQRHDDGTLSWK